MNNSQKCPFLCIGYRGNRQASLERSLPKEKLMRSSGLIKLTSHGSDLGRWARTSSHRWDVHPVRLEPHSLAIERQNASSDAREILFRWQVCSGDSLFWFGHEKVQVMFQLTGYRLCNAPSICVMELHVIQGMRQFIKFCKQKSP